MKKRSMGIIAALLTLCMILVMSPVGIYADGEAWDGESYDTSWYNTTDTSFTISTPAQLRALALIVNGTKPDDIAKNNFKGKTITLGADIDLGGKAWTPISDKAANLFCGDFDGAGHTVSGLYVYANDWGGLFGSVKSSDASNCVAIRNLTVRGSVTVTATKTGANPIGGLCAVATNVVIENCIVDVMVSVSCNEGRTAYSGGMVGRAVTNLTMTNCINMGNVSGCNYVAGLVAFTQESSSPCHLVMTNCANLGNISGQSYVGGLVGNFANSGNSATNQQSELINCYNTGNISAAVDYAGGISATLAYSSGSVGNNVKNCFTTGTVTGGEGAENVGAVFGKSTNPADVFAIELVSDVYYLAGSCGQAIGSGADLNIASLSAAELAAADFVTTLNTNALSLGATEDVFKAGQNHPIFVWLPDEVSALEPGDINGDGYCDENDVERLIGYIMGTYQPDSSGLAAADVNGNSLIDENDVTYLIQKVLIH